MGLQDEAEQTGRLTDGSVGGSGDLRDDGQEKI